MINLCLFCTPAPSFCFLALAGYLLLKAMEEETPIIGCLDKNHVKQYEVEMKENRLSSCLFDNSNLHQTQS